MRTSSTLFFALALAAGLALAGCGQNNDNNNAGNMGDQAQDTAQQAGNTVSNAAGQAAEATSDTAITTAVKSKLLANSSTSGMDIDVETDNGVVTLSGTVQTDSEKSLAERIANDTNGVDGVTNNLKVKSD